MFATREIINTYDYHDASGQPAFQVVRFAPKEFRQRRSVGPDQWEWGLNADTPRVPYRLPEICARPDDLIFLVEGEKDVETLRKFGLLATTLAGGAGAQWSPALAEHFTNRCVVVVPDNDGPGRALMARAGRALREVGAGVRWLDLPDQVEKADVTDWFAADPQRNAADFLRIALERSQPIDDVLARMPLAATSVTEDRMRVVERDLIHLERLIPADVRWLWSPWLPTGKLCLIDGDPGQGKSYVTLDLAARLSRGDAFPDGSHNPLGPQSTLLISCEDGLTDTVLPRLLAMGANPKYLHSYQGELHDGHPVRLPRLPDDMDLLESMIRACSARLVVIDPMMAFLAASVNSISDQSVRSVLAPMAGLAERTGTTILFVRHLNKTNGRQAVYRGGGSIGIIAAMRTAMLIARHPHDREQRVLAMVKCNLGPEPKSLGFRLQAAQLDPTGTEVQWTGPLDVKANDLVGDVKEVLPPREWLIEYLRDGPQPTGNIMTDAQSAGYSPRTIERAKAQLQLVAKRRAMEDGTMAWWWLPPGMLDLPDPRSIREANRMEMDPIPDLEPL